MIFSKSGFIRLSDRREHEYVKDVDIISEFLFVELKIFTCAIICLFSLLYTDKPAPVRHGGVARQVNRLVPLRSVRLRRFNKRSICYGTIKSLTVLLSQIKKRTSAASRTYIIPT